MDRCVKKSLSKLSVKGDKIVVSAKTNKLNISRQSIYFVRFWRYQETPRVRKTVELYFIKGKIKRRGKSKWLQSYHLRFCNECTIGM